MHLLGKHIDKLEPEDITNLIENGVAESIKLEYKQELPRLQDTSKKLQWLALVSSFANKDGGVIIYGIKEKRDKEGKSEGIPEEITGLIELNSDQLGLQMGQVLNAGLDPKLSTPRFRPMEIDGKTIFIIGILRSLFAPHVVWFEKNGRFWVRNNNGKEQMDVHQLRRAFLQSEEWEKEADNFRRKRIMDVRSGESVSVANRRGTFFFHIIPLGHRRETPTWTEFTQSRSFSDELVNLLNPPRVWANEVSHRLNMDGLLVYSNEKPHEAYIQYFRNGSCEIYSSNFYVPESQNMPACVVGGWIMELVHRYTQSYIRFASGHGLDPPYGIFLSLLDVEDLLLIYDTFRHVPDKTFDRRDVMLDARIVSDIGDGFVEVAQGLLDELAQSAGWSYSPKLPTQG